jgi:hypothetical protein
LEQVVHGCYNFPCLIISESIGVDFVLGEPFIVGFDGFTPEYLQAILEEFGLAGLFLL